MSAGLPGLGLGGLFFVVSALLAPLFELWRALNGRSSPEAWRQVWRQFSIAACMVVAVDLALRVVLFAVWVAGAGPAPTWDRLTVLPLAPIGITAGLMVVVLVAAKGLQFVVRAPLWMAARRDRRHARNGCAQPCSRCAELRGQA